MELGRVREQVVTPRKGKGTNSAHPCVCVLLGNQECHRHYNSLPPPHDLLLQLSTSSSAAQEWESECRNVAGIILQYQLYMTILVLFYRLYTYIFIQA